ncbi:unnamed protein product [Anisakis simplex]|uniref:F-box domain-containing protein n=1 Tax=Anisakis simplex TaxID=6269 RepID=A0A0M3K303_ANISI|nr:unnamed protein product [Anisakis simplex]
MAVGDISDCENNVSMFESNGWAALPDVLLEEIFSTLPIKNLGRCAQVGKCAMHKNVSRGKHPTVSYAGIQKLFVNYPWRRFQFEDFIFTRRKFTSHSGWQYTIDHWRLRFLIMRAASKWRELEIKPVTILFNLYEFFRVLTNFSEYYEKTSDDRPLQGIRSFIFRWQLHFEQQGDHHMKVVGTGGEMLKTLSLLLSHLHGLSDLALYELQLEPWESNYFVDEVSAARIWILKLQTYAAVNFPRAFLQIGLFLNLEHLTVSPQHLDESVITLIADLKRLQSFTIYQNEKSVGSNAVSAATWRAFASSNTHTRVYLILSGQCHCDLLIQPNAPVYAIIYENSNGQLTADVAQQFANSMGFAAKLKLLAIRERISFGTILLLSLIARDHRTTLCVRRNALLKRRNWSSSEIHAVLGENADFGWFRRSCSSYEAIEQQIRLITGSGATIVSDNRYLYSF